MKDGISGDLTVQEYIHGFEDILRRQLAAGRSVEFGWGVFLQACAAMKYPEGFAEVLKKAFYSGAQHAVTLYSVVLVKDTPPTPEDMRMSEGIIDELTKFHTEWLAEVNAQMDAKENQKPD